MALWRRAVKRRENGFGSREERKEKRCRKWRGWRIKTKTTSTSQLKTGWPWPDRPRLKTKQKITHFLQIQSTLDIMNTSYNDIVNIYHNIFLWIGLKIPLDIENLLILWTKRYCKWCSLYPESTVFYMIRKRSIIERVRLRNGWQRLRQHSELWYLIRRLRWCYQIRSMQVRFMEVWKYLLYNFWNKVFVLFLSVSFFHKSC